MEERKEKSFHKKGENWEGVKGKEKRRGRGEGKGGEPANTPRSRRGSDGYT